MGAKKNSKGGLQTYQTKKLEDLKNEINAAEELLEWQLMHHGKCVSCTTCVSGQYNYMCNKWEDGLKDNPSGKCNNCLT